MVIENKQILVSDIVLLLIALAAMNFFLIGSYVILFALFLSLFLKKNTVPKCFAFACLVALAMSFVLFEVFSSNSHNLRIIAAPCAFLIAYNLDSDLKTYDTKKTLLFVAYSMAIHSVISAVYMLGSQGISVFSSGRTIDLWSGSISASTAIASYYYFLAATIPLLFMRIRWHHFVLLGVCLLHDILIGGRTFIVLSLIAVVATLGIQILGGTKRFKAFIVYLLVLGIIVGAGIILYRNNFFGIRSTFESSYMYHRFFSDDSRRGIGDTDRWARKVIYLQNLLKYPFGGNHLRNELNVGYAHDIWLDTFDDSGLLTLILLLAYTASSVFRFLRYARVCSDSFEEKVVFLLFPIILMAAFFIEPILHGCPMVFFMYCFMDGMICRKMHSFRREENDYSWQRTE